MKPGTQAARGALDSSKVGALKLFLPAERRPVARARLAFLVLLGASLLAACAAERRPGCETQRLAFGRDFGVFVVDGCGRQILSFEPEWSSESSLEIGYFHPDVSPDSSRFVMVSCSGLERYYGAIRPRPGSEETCRLEFVDLATGESEVVAQSAADVGVASPVWSPDGKQIAVLQYSGLWIFDLASRGANGREVPELMPVKPWVGGPYGSAYLRWDPSGDRVYLVGDRDPSARLPDPASQTAEEQSKAVAEFMRTGGMSAAGVLEVDELEFQWLPLVVPNFVGGRYASHGVVIEPTGPDRSVATLVKKPMPNEPAVRALFGSAAHPVWQPVRVAGEADYFYIASDYGLLARRWIEGYDIERGRTFELRTIKRYLMTK